MKPRQQRFQLTRNTQSKIATGQRVYTFQDAVAQADDINQTAYPRGDVFLEPFAIDEGQVPRMDELMPDDREQVTDVDLLDIRAGLDEIEADWQREDYAYLKEVI